MGLISRILDSFTKDGVPSAKVEIFKGDNANARIFNPPGIDARPLDDDICFTEVSEDTEGGKDVLGFIDPKNAPVSGKGEFRPYSRDSAGDKQAQLELKKDGLIEMKNQLQQFSLLLGELFTEIRDITTFGSPTLHQMSADSKAKFTTLENKFKQLFG